MAALGLFAFLTVVADILPRLIHGLAAHVALRARAVTLKARLALDCRFSCSFAAFAFHKVLTIQSSERWRVRLLVLSLLAVAPAPLTSLLGACIWVGDTLAASGAFHCFWLTVIPHRVHIGIYHIHSAVFVRRDYLLPPSACAVAASECC